MLILSFEWRGPGAHYVAMEMSQWKYHETKFVLITITVQSFSSIQKMSSEIIHFL